jgi:predicted AAA+ superfamily ATPase
MKEYKTRVIDAELDELLQSLPAVALEGPKGVGKSETCQRRARTKFRLDELAQRAIAEADPANVLTAPRPVLIDEWQFVPAIWDAVRRAVDADHSANQFLLAGPAAPANAPTHSGAARIITVRMRPLSIAEREVSTPTVSLQSLLLGERPAIAGQTDIGLREYAHEICRSGFPGIRHLTGRALRAQLDGYLQLIVDRDFAEQGYVVRRPDALRRWLTAFAAATATCTTFEKIRTAATSGEGNTPTKPTSNNYRAILEQLWILDSVPGWLPSRNQLARLTQSPKHHLADPALAARLLGVDERALLEGTTAAQATASVVATPRDGALMGQLFESLVTLSVRVYAQHAEARVRHLRTRDGRQEIDLIVERDDQKVLAIEVKLSATVTDADVKHLLWLREQLGDDVLDLVIITTGTHCYRRKDGVAVIPAALLGP